MTTWTWLRAKNYSGTLATIVCQLATDEQLRLFQEFYGNKCEQYNRPAGIYWDGSKMSAADIKRVKKNPLDVYKS